MASPSEFDAAVKAQMDAIQTANKADEFRSSAEKMNLEARIGHVARVILDFLVYEHTELSDGVDFEAFTRESHVDHQDDPMTLGDLIVEYINLTDWKVSDD